MKLVGSDGGRYEREKWVDDVVIAPSERAIVDLCFSSTGRFALQHLTPERTYELGWFEVGESSKGPVPTEFEDLRVNDDMVRERERATAYLDTPPDKTLALVAEMDFDEPVAGAEVLYMCPMHSEVTSGTPGSCPKCGMKLMPITAVYSCPMHPEVMSLQPGHCPQCGMKLMPLTTVPQARVPESGSHDEGHSHGTSTSEGIEWEDDMVEVNRATTPQNMRWKIVDRGTGRENADIDWVFEQDDQVKIRIFNEMESDHPMHHPFHVHGERFLVLARNGATEDNLVWKDTVLLRTGDVIDILLDASNPGLWMAHCHIAEHMESGMMFDFRVLAPT